MVETPHGSDPSGVGEGEWRQGRFPEDFPYNPRSTEYLSVACGADASAALAAFARSRDIPPSVSYVAGLAAFVAVHVRDLSSPIAISYGGRSVAVELEGATTFSSLVSAVDAASPTRSRARLAVRTGGTPTRADGYEDISWVVEDVGHAAHFEANAARFHPTTLGRCARRFERLIAQFIAHPEQALLGFDAVFEDERALLLKYGTGRVAAVDVPTALHRIVDVARHNPGRPAVGGARPLDYAALLGRSVALAGRLVAAGLGRGACVATLCERTSDEIVARLGVGMAGGFFLPLDRRWPRERLAFVVGDSDVSAVVCRESAGGLVSPALRVFSPDAESSAGPRPPTAEELIRPLGPSDLAYRIYTSGSTGKPKGVDLSHGGLASLLASLAREPGVGPEDVVVSTSNFSFDIAVLDLFLALWVGARVDIADDDELRDGAALAERVARSGMTFAVTTPGIWRMLIDAGWRGGPEVKMITGAEVLTSELSRALTARGARLWNAYGPTETTVCSTLYRVDSPTEGPTEPIGYALDNTTTRVVDGYGRLVPFGVEGELLIGGKGVAAGYHKRASLTGERFIPASSALGAGTLYRTGDRARVRYDGALEFLGRSDEQIKFRGFRIEPGEIASVLKRQTWVRDVLVELRGADERLRRLVAYVTVEPSTAAPADLSGALRAEAMACLPAYMVPSAYILLRDWPRTSSGKVDRRALPEPPAESALVKGDFSAEIVASVVAEALGIGAVGVDDEFSAFALDSLAAMRVVARLRAIGAGLTPADVYRYPTAAMLSDHVRRSRVVMGATSVPGDVPRPGDLPQRGGRFPDVVGALPMTAPQRAMLMTSLLNSPSPLLNEQISWRLAGAVDVPRLRAAWGAVIARHPVMRASFEWGDSNEPVQVVRQYVEPPWADYDWRDASVATFAERCDDLGRDDLLRAFELARPCCHRFSVAAGPGETYFAFFTVHSVALDGASLLVLFRDLWSAYRQLPMDGVCPPAPPARPWAPGSDEVTERKQAAFWRSTFEGFTAVTRLPNDALHGLAPWHPSVRRVLRARARVALNYARRPDARSMLTAFAGSPETPAGLRRVASALAGLADVGVHTLSADVEPRLDAAARRLIATARVTYTTLMLGTLSLVLMRELGCRDVAVLFIASGRDAGLEVPDAVGNLAVRLPFRARVADGDSIGAWLRRQRTSMLDTLDHRATPPPLRRRSLPLKVLSEITYEETPRWQAVPTSMLPFRVTPGRYACVATGALTCRFSPGDEPSFAFDYDVGHLAGATALRLFDAFQALFARLVTWPADTPVATLLSSALGRRTALR